MSNKVFCILGKFASGKTTVAKSLQEKYSFKRIVTCTTRSPREGERDGVDYYFLSDREFELLADKGKLIAIKRIPIIKKQPNLTELVKNLLTALKSKGSKKYGVPRDKIDLLSGSYVCVIEPSGYYDLVEKLGKDSVKSIFLRLDDKERWLRALNREINPDISAIVDKHLEEVDLYDSIEANCDKLIDNVGTSDRAVLEILEYIKNS